MSFHPKVLGLSQKRLLRRLGPAVSAQEFYLGGGTALAVHLGHRRSIDLDWFTHNMPFEPLDLAHRLSAGGLEVRDAQTQRGTLHATIRNVRVSFIEYGYPLLKPPVEWPAYKCRLASIEDIACMKLSAVAQRGSKKDFVDVHALCTRFRPLGELIALYRARYRTGEIGHVIYGLSFFDDAEKDRMPAMLWKTDWPEVKKAIAGWIAGLT